MADPYLAGYKVHYGQFSRGYTAHLDVGNAVRHTVGGLEDCRSYYLAVTAYNSFGDESGYSGEVPVATACPVQETIATPSAPAGPSQGLVGEAYTYVASGAVSNVGDLVQYRFSWSDGSVSDWLPPGTTAGTKSWGAPGAYTSVLVQARCSVHPSIVSELSPSIVVTIGGAVVETISTPAPPAGPTSGVVGVAYDYTTGGAVSSAGDPVQYRFAWSDGTVSEWLPAAAAAAAKAWSAPGTYTGVRAEARCALHQEVLADPSAPISVTIAEGTAETLTQPTVLSGPAETRAGTAAPFTAGGALSDVGDPVRHRLDWGDGTISEWAKSDTTLLAWKTWAVPGGYLVRAEAGCALHPAIAALSPGFGVSVVPDPALLFQDDFDDANDRGDPEWRTLSGRWAGQAGTLAALSAGSDNLIVVRPLRAFTGGRIDTRLKLRRREDVPNGGVVFSCLDGSHYRYLLASKGALVLGQVGDTPRVKGGVVQTVRTTLPANRWHTLKTQVYPDGTVRAYLNEATTPVLKYRFNDFVPGKVGYLARTSRATFDEMRIWDQSVLPERR